MLESVLQRHIHKYNNPSQRGSLQRLRNVHTFQNISNTSATSHDINTTSRVNQIRKAQQIPLSLLKAIKKRRPTRKYLQFIKIFPF